MTLAVTSLFGSAGADLAFAQSAVNQLLPCDSKELRYAVKTAVGFLAQVGMKTSDVLKSPSVIASLKEDKAGSDYRICSSSINFIYGEPMTVTERISQNGRVTRTLGYMTGVGKLGTFELNSAWTNIPQGEQ